MSLKKSFLKALPLGLGVWIGNWVSTPLFSPSGTLHEGFWIGMIACAIVFILVPITDWISSKEF